VQNRPAAAPQVGPWTSDFRFFKNPTFAEAISAVSTLVFAFAGTPAFFAIVSEMRNPGHYNRSLFVCQGGVTTTYITIGTIVYYFCGSYVASPALGSAGTLMKKVAYGLALPGLIATTTLVIHVSIPAASHFARALANRVNPSCRPSTSLFGCSEDRSISRPTALSIGRAG
jgi:amino acid permease